MNPEQALKVIEEALDIATTKGAFNLSHTSHIVQSIITIQKFIELNGPKEDQKIKK